MDAEVVYVFECLIGSPRSHLPFRLLADPVGELNHLRVDAGAVLPRTALTPAHDPGQEPPPASLQTHQRAPGVPLDDTFKQKTLIVVRKLPVSWLSPGLRSHSPGRHPLRPAGFQRKASWE